MSEQEQKHYIGHCPKCHYTLFAEEENITSGQDWRKLYPGEARRVQPEDANVPLGVYAHCDQRGHKAFRLYEITGTYNPNHKCDDRCKFAKGNECTCACGGANHGTGHAAQVQAKIPEPRETHDWRNDPISPAQKTKIKHMLDERVLDEDADKAAEKLSESLSRLDGLTKGQASAWIDKLLTLPEK